MGNSHCRGSVTIKCQYTKIYNTMTFAVTTIHCQTIITFMVHSYDRGSVKYYEKIYK